MRTPTQPVPAPTDLLVATLHCVAEHFPGHDK